MSTFIYNDGVLYADTRSILNFPHGVMIRPVKESKVVSTNWCYMAISGYVPESNTQKHIFNLLTALESLFYYERACKQTRTKLWSLLFKAAAEICVAIENTIVAVAGDTGFLAMTRQRIYSMDANNDSKDRTRFRSMDLDHQEVVGSCSLAAQKLLVNGVPPKDIYPILRRNDAPTGEVCEMFSTDKLSDLIPPWSHLRVWVFAAGYLKKHNSEVLSEEFKNNYITMISVISILADYRSETSQVVVRYSDEKIKTLIDQIQTGEIKENPYYKNMKGLLFS